MHQVRTLLFRAAVSSLNATMELTHTNQISAGGPQEERARPLAAAAATLLVDWLVDCPKAVAALLNAPEWVDATIAVLIERYVDSVGNETPQKSSTSNAHHLDFPQISPQASSLRRLDLLLVRSAPRRVPAVLRRRFSGTHAGKVPCGDFDASAEK